MTATESTATSFESLLGTVGEAMTGQVVVLEADTPVDVALRRLEHTQVSGAPVLHHGCAVLAMERASINRLPVVDATGRPAGILTRDDVLRALARRIREPGRSPRHGSRIEPD